MKGEPFDTTIPMPRLDATRERHPAPIPLERDEVTLGRALEADVRVNDARASRMHARISVERDAATGESRYRITDLGSTNGTLLNGAPVTDAYLQDGDKLTVGEQLLRFDLLDDIDREYQRQIHRLLAHDELTGLLTSKSFFSELRREAARAETEVRPFCVLMTDLDHFKTVNDTHGHLVGSQTLEEVGAVITAALRAGDVAARFGAAGESNETLRITISIGVAAYPEDARDPIELIELADTALYRAKNLGRNRVVAYCVSPPDLPATGPGPGEPR